MFMDWKTTLIKVHFFTNRGLKFNAILTRTPAGFLKIEFDKLIIKLLRKCKRARIAGTIFKKNNVRRLIIVSSFKTYHKTLVIAIVCQWHKKKKTFRAVEPNRMSINKHITLHM